MKKHLHQNASEGCSTGFLLHDYVRKSSLSEGSGDQLYLALRLASLETYLENHEPIPLVADDILIQFDNCRATAALQALADLSRCTQIILFTHHEHVRGLAKSCIDPDVLFIYCLPGRQVGSQATAAWSRR